MGLRGACNGCGRTSMLFKYENYFYCPKCLRKENDKESDMIKGKYKDQPIASGADEKIEKTITDLIDDFQFGAMKFVSLEAPIIYKRIVEKWNILRDSLTEHFMSDTVVRKQDEIIGRLTREVEDLRDSATRRADWLRKAKEEADFPLNESFDNVWKKTLEKAKRFDSIDMSRDEVEECVVDYVKEHGIDNTEVAYPYLIAGFMLCLGIARNADGEKEKTE